MVIISHPKVGVNHFLGRICRNQNGLMVAVLKNMVQTMFKNHEGVLLQP